MPREQRESELDWRQELDSELDCDADDDLLDVTSPDVIEVLGFDPLEFVSDR